jgi:hypothetical protein
MVDGKRCGLRDQWNPSWSLRGFACQTYASTSNSIPEHACASTCCCYHLSRNCVSVGADVFTCVHVLLHTSTTCLFPLKQGESRKPLRLLSNARWIAKLYRPLPLDFQDGIRTALVRTRTANGVTMVTGLTDRLKASQASSVLSHSICCVHVAGQCVGTCQFLSRSS